MKATLGNHLKFEVLLQQMMKLLIDQLLALEVVTELNNYNNDAFGYEKRSDSNSTEHMFVCK
jgi:hypothetical protein